MLHPLDGFTLAHGFMGLFLARIRLHRYLFYPIPIIWEIYQYFFHYQPQDYTLGDIWLNSLVDILVCVCCYEASSKYLIKYNKYPLGFKINNNYKMIIAYIVITFGITWLFWDDLIRGKFVEDIPMVQIPLILGSLSPLFAAFIVHKYLINTEPENNHANLDYTHGNSRSRAESWRPPSK